jgi:hypothetical protein
MEPRYGTPLKLACTGMRPLPPSAATTASGTSTRCPPTPRPEGRSLALNRVFAMRGAYPCDFVGVVPNLLVAVRTPHR